MPKSRVTVLRRDFFPDLAEKYLANLKAGPYSHFRDGQEFVFDSENFYLIRGGFCTEAWDAISRYINVQVSGGVMMNGWTNNEKVMISCCNDGVRPVIFKIKRIND